MTLIELLAVLAPVGLATVGFIAGAAHGPMFAVFSALACAASLPLLGLLIASVEGTLSGRPFWPACRSCPRPEYEFVRELGRSVARCVCGASYVRHGRQCLHLLPGGATRPFLRWRPLRGWVLEGAANVDHAGAPYR